MRSFVKKSLHKCAALPADISLPLTAEEDQIFRFTRAACDDIGAIAGTKPTARVAGGWVKTA